MLPQKHILLGCVFASLIGCGSAAPAQSRIDQLAVQISAYRTDPDVIAFLATEAAMAGVKSIGSYSESAYINGRAPGFGVAMSGGRILIDGTTPAGRSIVNITHEIAHVASFGGKCGGHNAGWLRAYRAIAMRFEQQFPAAKWSGTTPTARVDRNVGRYQIGTRC